MNMQLSMQIEQFSPRIKAVGSLGLTQYKAALYIYTYILYKGVISIILQKIEATPSHSHSKFLCLAPPPLNTAGYS